MKLTPLLSYAFFLGSACQLTAFMTPSPVALSSLKQQHTTGTLTPTSVTALAANTEFVLMTAGTAISSIGVIFTIITTSQNLQQGQERLQQEVKGVQQEVKGLQQGQERLQQGQERLQQGQERLHQEVKGVQQRLHQEVSTLRSDFKKKEKKRRLLEEIDNMS